MPGKHATDHQVRRYMGSRKDGYSQAAAAARAGFSERTGRRIEADPILPSQQGRTRRYRTRQDPFVEVWREELVPAHFRGLNEIIAAEAGAVVKTIGDAVMATFPTPDRAVAAALRMREAMRSIKHGDR